MQNLNDTNDYFQFDASQEAKINFHFPNRIFDRDTLIVLHFRINFLFVITTYIERNTTKQNNFKQKAIKMIRENVLAYFNENYDFYKLETANVEQFVNEHFRKLIGKIYRTSKMESSLILGLEKENDESEQIKNMFGESLNPYTFTKISQ